MLGVENRLINGVVLFYQVLVNIERASSHGESYGLVECRYETTKLWSHSVLNLINHPYKPYKWEVINNHKQKAKGS